MNRIIAILAVVAVLVVGGWSAFWYSNRGEVDGKIREALQTLERAGAPNQFDAIEISGFPFSYRGEVTNLTVQAPAGTITLPEVAAQISLDRPNTVLFQLPERFEIVPSAGGSAPQRVSIVSDALLGEVSLVGEDAYDLAMSAAKLTVEPTGDGPIQPATMTNLAASGELRTVAADGSVRLALALSAATAEQAFAAPDQSDPTAEPMRGRATARDPRFGVEGSLTELAAKASAQSLLLEFDGGGVFEAQELSYALSAAPKERFDPAPLAGVVSFEAAIQAFAQMAAAGVAEGGDFRGEVSMSGLKGSGSIEGEQSTADVGKVAATLEFGAERVGFDFEGDRFLIDVKTPGPNDLYYKASDLKASLSARPADAFDFSALPAAAGDPDRLGEALFGAIWAEVQQGGAIEFVSSSGPSVTRAPTEPGSPFGLLESEAGPSSSRIALNSEEAVVKVLADGVTYRVSDGMRAGGAVKRFEIDFFAPLKAAPQEQKATLQVLLDQIELDEETWALIDPDAALTREINGLKIGAEAGLTIQRDILSPQADLYNLGNPVAIPGAVAVEDTYLDLLGLRADLAGSVSVFPLPKGAMTLDLAGWRRFLESVQKTPLGQDPQTASSLLIMDGYVQKYGRAAEGGDPAAGDATRFQIEIAPTGVTVNGAPFEG